MFDICNMIDCMQVNMSIADILFVVEFKHASFIYFMDLHMQLTVC